MIKRSAFFILCTWSIYAFELKKEVLSQHKYQLIYEKINRIERRFQKKLQLKSKKSKKDKAFLKNSIKELRELKLIYQKYKKE